MDRSPCSPHRHPVNRLKLELCQLNWSNTPENISRVNIGRVGRVVQGSRRRSRSGGVSRQHKRIAATNNQGGKKAIFASTDGICVFHHTWIPRIVAANLLKISSCSLPICFFFTSMFNWRKHFKTAPPPPSRRRKSWLILHHDVMKRHNF